MGRSGEPQADQGATRSYLKSGNLLNRMTGGDPSAVLWLRLLPLVALVPVPLMLLDPVLLRYAYLIFAFPALTALVNGPVPTAVAAVAVCLFVASGAEALGLLPITASGWPDVGAAVAVGGLSVGLAWIRDRVVLRLLDMTSVAETTQRAIMPELPERIGTFEVASVYRTPEGSPGLVGGDFFDVQCTEYGLRAVVGDVQGHDLTTVRVTEALLGSFREGVLDDADLWSLSGRLERRVGLDNRDRGEWDQTFATAALIEIPPGEAVVRVVLCGHPAPLLVHHTAKPLEVKPRPPLGLATLGPPSAEVLEVPLSPGDLVVAFTDGLVEARDKGGRAFPLTSYLNGHVAAGHREPHRLRALLRADFNKGGFQRVDDLSLVILRVPGDADGAAG
ncbi:PP2C family protein-serine/threonine phosphatase [Glycomyces tenuis]|uniref:PP2C family protein-serine/threonine phosphatase n=1 Tax=Glycomyces tenuis TaxID=58116 RepID=UPI00040CE712|nr:PP2C family protein-serine/threonine phosphatase [Glycomyces tenuis]